MLPARALALVSWLPFAACGGAEAEPSGSVAIGGGNIPVTDAGALMADAAPLPIGPLTYDLEGAHKDGQLVIAKRMGGAWFQISGSADDQVLTINVMRAVPLVGTGAYSCDSTVFVRFSMRAAFYTSEMGSCMLDLSDVGGVGEPIAGVFSAV